MNGWTEALRTYESLQPFQVAAYLRSRGWLRNEEIRDVASVWIPALTSDAQAEVILPTDTTVGDFAVRMAELIHALAVVERRPAAEILTDITLSTSDVVRLALVGEAYDNGTIPIETGARLVGLARDAILAAASVTVMPRALLSARKPDLAVEFLRKVRLGQTERGSYVLTIQSPVRPDLEFQPALIADPDKDPYNDPHVPYERRVMLRLAHALDAARRAAADAAETGSPQSFLSAVEDGVSANLCDAIAGMLESSETQGLIVRFTWSPTRPEQSRVPTFVPFDKAAAAVLSEASRIFRERASQTDFELEGEVIQLRRPSGFKGGQVVIAALIGDRPHAVEIELQAPDYLDAIDAHKGEVRVRCRGELVRHGGRYVILNATDFQVESL